MRALTSPTLRRRRKPAILAFMAMAALVASCGGGTADGGSAGSKTSITVPATEFVDNTTESTVDITIKDNEFTPAYVIVTAGSKVIWTDIGANAHNIVPMVDGSFKGTDADLTKGSSHTVTFATVGDFPYFCSIHGSMHSGQRGGIRVVAKK